MKISIFAAICLLSGPAFAQQGEIAPIGLGKKALQGKAVEAEGEPVAPWAFSLNLGLSGSLSDSRDVVGQLTGSTTNVGLVLDGAGAWKSGQHEVENLLKIQHGQTSAPPTDVFVKSMDQLELASTYLYYLEAVSWLGPYARAKLSTNVLKSNLVFAEDVDVQRGGGAPQTVEAGERIEVNGPVEPLTLFQSTGMFAKPLSGKILALEAKVGIGAQEIFVRDGAVAAGEPADVEGADRKVLVLADLEGSTAAGAEVEVAAGGALTDNLTYGVKVNLFQPFAGADEGKDGLQTDFTAKASAKLNKWASLDYVMSAKKIPAIQGNDGKFQLSNAFMVTAGFNLL